MLITETSICNQALGHLGERPIASMDEDTVAARACKLHYDHTRDEWLRAHRWNFAISRKKLSKLADAPAFGWKYAFQLPSDFRRALAVNGVDGDGISEEWVVEGQQILTDAEEVKLRYVQQVEDTAMFDPLFAQALVLKLAVNLSSTIRGTTQKTGELLAMLEQMAAPLARRIDANEGRRRKGLISLQSNFIRARGDSSL